ncbi:MAG: hypothetical protein ABSF26_04760 [Thermoguttaceae bacterium]|jgi:hypothetical protein
MKPAAALVAVVALCNIGLTAHAVENVTVVIEQSETAVISGFRKAWDTSIIVDSAKTPGTKPLILPTAPAQNIAAAKPPAMVFDAAHRSLLVRFPGAAEKIAEQLAKGMAVHKVDLFLPFDKTEIEESTQAGYNLRTSFGAGDLFRRVQPQWHAVAWALRKPWTADKDLGPTFNAYVNGSGFWGKYGAQDTQKDRIAKQFGPAEVSTKAADGRMDVTASVTDESFGETLADRLRRLGDCGFLVRKWEVYDMRYREAGQGAYEWAVATGGRGIVVKQPRLAVTFGPGKAETITLPPAANVKALAARLQSRPDGHPTAFLPNAEQLKAILEKYVLRRPAWMSLWQWQRVDELDKLGGGYRIPATVGAYAQWVDNMLPDPPRYWNGWDVPDRLLTFYLYKDAVPAYALDFYCYDYWNAWLMPDRPTKEFEHPQAVELWHKGKNVYYEKTGDWRGNASFFRDGYCYAMSTMNFNHTAAMGALLAGNMIGSKLAMEDGRYGLEHWPLRTWCWFDGSTQESIDHYYFGLTLSDQKMFADFGPTHLDRLMGMSMMAKSVEELTSSYHPGLRRFIASSTRTSVPEYLLVTQDALQHIVHTLSHSGALHDLTAVRALAAAQPVFAAQEPVTKLPVIGQDTPPGRIAQQTVTGPWAPDWAANMVDEKPIPYEMTNAYKQWGGHAAHPLWRRTYLGRNYGLASTDLYDSCVPIMGHWRRQDKQVQDITEMGLMLVRYGINTTAFVNAAPGWLVPCGSQAALQHKNKMLVVASPYDLHDRADIKSLQSSIALYNYQQPAATWETCIDGRRVESLPAKAKAGQRITIRDGVSYLGVIPLPATNLGRKDEAELAAGEVQKYQNMEFKAALVINNYNLQQDQPLDKAAAWRRIDNAYGGFVIEMADAAEYKDFAAFQRHMSEARLEATPKSEGQHVTLEVKYTSGEDTMEMGVKTDYKGGPTTDCFTYRRVNGNWPYLPKGLERDTSLTQQGSTGRLQKGGATLTSSPGLMAYLQTEPITGTYAGFNPLPDPNYFNLAVPGGVVVRADGKLGIARVVVRPKENKVWIDHGLRDDQHGPEMADCLLLFGLQGEPVVELNGRPAKVAQAKGPLRSNPLKVNTADGEAYVLPLSAGTINANTVQERYAKIRKLATEGFVEKDPIPLRQ